MRLPRYAEYKDSGVAWLGEIPSHWDTRRLKRLFEIRKRIAGEEGHQVLSITQRGIKIKDIESNDGQQSMDYSKYQFVKPGDFAMNHMDLLTGYVDISQEFGVTSPDYRVFVVREGVECEPTFFLRLFQNGYRQKIFYAFGQGASEFGRWRFPTDQFNDFCFPCPPPAEQVAIATFLGRETGKIDALIAEQEKLLTLLAEKRQATISHAVTRGLNPDAPMKDSGVPWMGEVPAHWAIAKLGHFATVENGTTPSRIVEDYWQGGDVPWLASGEVNQVFIDESSEFITKMALERCSLRLLPVGTVVVGMIGQGKTRGMAALLRIPATINQNLAAICPDKKVLGEYVLYVLHAVYEWLREAGRGGNQAAMNCEMLSALRIPMPPIEEQKEIVAFIEIEVGKLDSLRFAGEHAIDLLRERRSALIAAAVTGKVDVRPAA